MLVPLQVLHPGSTLLLLARSQADLELTKVHYVLNVTYTVKKVIDFLVHSPLPGISLNKLSLAGNN
jgi:hypothetical protein